MPAHTKAATPPQQPPSYEMQAGKVRAAHKAAGFVIDESGIKRLLVTLRALGLIDWQDAPASTMMPPDVHL